MRSDKQATGESTTQQLAKLRPDSFDEAVEIVQRLVAEGDQENFIRLILGLTDKETQEQIWLIEAAFKGTTSHYNALEIYKQAIREGYSPDEDFSPYHPVTYDDQQKRYVVPAPRQNDQPSSDPLALADAIAAILNHPDVPGELYDAMVDRLSTMHDSSIGDMDTDRDLLRVWIPRYIAAQKEDAERPTSQPTPASAEISALTMKITSSVDRFAKK